MLKISRESEINLINMMIDQDIIAVTDLAKIKEITDSAEGEKTQIEAVFELNLTDENKILDVLVKEQQLSVADLSSISLDEDVKKILPTSYINQNFIAPFKLDGNTLHIAIPDTSKLGLMRNLKIIAKKDIELHAAKISHINDL